MRCILHRPLQPRRFVSWFFLFFFATNHAFLDHEQSPSTHPKRQGVRTWSWRTAPGWHRLVFMVQMSIEAFDGTHERMRAAACSALVLGAQPQVLTRVRGYCICADVDSLLHELSDMKLDLPASRGTDQYARKLGALGAAERRPSGVPERPLGRALVAEAAASPATSGFDASSRPTTAQILEELERRGLEDGLESPVRLGCTASPARDEVLGTPQVLNAVRENSVDDLLQDLADMDEEHGEFAKQAQLCSAAPRRVVPAAPQDESSVADRPPKSSSCAVM